MIHIFHGMNGDVEVTNERDIHYFQSHALSVRCGFSSALLNKKFQQLVDKYEAAALSANGDISIQREIA